VGDLPFAKKRKLDAFRMTKARKDKRNAGPKRGGQRASRLSPKEGCGVIGYVGTRKKTSYWFGEIEQKKHLARK